MAYKIGNGTDTTSAGSAIETTTTLKWFQNLQSGLRSRRTEMANRRNIGNISRIVRFSSTQRLSPRGGFETTSYDLFPGSSLETF